MNALRKDLRISTAEGATTSVTVGIGENYLPAFVLAVSGSQLACGLITTVPLVAGAVLQLIAPWIIRRLGSYRRWVALCAALQAAAFLPLAVAALVGAVPLLLVFASVALYWAASLASSGPWNVWMKAIVPEEVQARYFARRGRVVQWGVSAGFVAGGVALHGASPRGSVLLVFAGLFLAAAASRLMSAWLLTTQSELGSPRHQRLPSLRTLFVSLAGGPNARVLFYLLAAQVGVQISAPYFNPYMLGRLQFSYSAYVTLICVASLAKIAVLPALGRAAESRGALAVFRFGAIGIVFLPGLWLVSNGFAFLVGVQILSGIAWAACDLATLLLLFEQLPPHRHVGLLSAFNLVYAATTALGSFIGAGILAAGGATREAYFLVFAVSMLARAAAMVFLIPAPVTLLKRYRLPRIAPTNASQLLILHEGAKKGAEAAVGAATRPHLGAAPQKRILPLANGS